MRWRSRGLDRRRLENNPINMRLAFAILILLPGCSADRATGGFPRTERLPSPAEVAAHVRQDWAEDYGRRFARFEARDDQRAELVSISNVTCAYSYATPECMFDIEGRFPDGTLRQRQMFEQFGWTDDGRLKAVIVMYHRRR